MESDTVGYMMPFVLGAIGLVVVAFLVYLAVQAWRSRPFVTLTGPLDLWAPTPSPVIVDRGTVRNKMAGSFTLALFLKIDAVPDVRAAGTPVLVLPNVMQVAYNPGSETLVLTVLDQIIVVPRMPLQRWNQLVITAEGRTWDLYVNGTLATSAQLSNVAPVGNASLTVVPGNVMGSVALAQIWSRRLTVGEVASNYAVTADSQGQPFIRPSLLAPLQNISRLKMPSLDGDGSAGTTATAAQSQKWEFPYA